MRVRLGGRRTLPAVFSGVGTPGERVPDGDAIAREKQIKGGSRAKKLALIEAGNPQWRDWYLELNE